MQSTTTILMAALRAVSVNQWAFAVSLDSGIIDPIEYVATLAQVLLNCLAMACAMVIDRMVCPDGNEWKAPSDEKGLNSKAP